MRVLLISNHFPPDVNPSGKLMAQLADGWRQHDINVDVLTTFPHYEGFRIDDAHRGSLIEHENVGADRVTRVWAFASGKKQNMKHRLLNYLSFNVLATVVGVLRKQRYDVVFANSGSFFTGISSWLLDTIRDVPFIYNVQDIYPDVPVRAGQLRNANAIAALEKIESFMYRRATHVTVISREQERVLLNKGVPASKLSVIPNFVDTSFITPQPRDNAFSAANGLQRSFVLAHAGNLGFAYDFDTLIECASQLQNETDILFLIIGEGVQKNAIAEMLEKRALKNVRMMPFQPEAELPQMRAAIDVQLALYRPGAAQSSMPSKVYEVMASARPVIAAAEQGTELYELVKGGDSGIVVPPADVAALKNAILSMRDQQQRERMGQNGRREVEARFSKASAVERYVHLLKQVAQQ